MNTKSNGKSSLFCLFTFAILALGQAHAADDVTNALKIGGSAESLPLLRFERKAVKSILESPTNPIPQPLTKLNPKSPARSTFVPIDCNAVRPYTGEESTIKKRNINPEIWGEVQEKRHYSVLQKRAVKSGNFAGLVTTSRQYPTASEQLKVRLLPRLKILI
jgi:hypothetical protein